MTRPRSTVGVRFSSLFLATVVVGIAACGDQASFLEIEEAPAPVVVAEFVGEVVDGKLSIRVVPTDALGGVREQELTQVVEDKNGTRGTATVIDRFEFAVEQQSGTFEGDVLGQQPNGCGTGIPSVNFAITARGFQLNGLASTYMELISITSGGVDAPQFALCNSEAASPNLRDDLTGTALSDTLGLIRYGNLRPDASPLTPPGDLTVGADGTAATMIWKFRDGNFQFRGRVLGVRCTSDLCAPGFAMGEGRGVPATQSDFWEPLGPVNAIAQGNGVAYIGGEFDVVAPRTGRSATFDLSKPTTADIPVRPYAGFEGNVRAVVPDNAGGYYVAGNALRAGFQASAASVWHVLPSGIVDPAFVPVTVAGGTGATPPAAQVRALALVGGKLYVGGAFSTVTPLAGVVSTRLNAVALNAATGAVLGFAPTFDAPVNAIVVDGTRVYFGGSFTTPRSRFAAFTTATDTLDGLILADLVDGDVNALAVAPGRVFVGGSFTATPASSGRLGAWSTSTGTRDGLFLPRATGTVRALAFRATGSSALFVAAGAATGAFTLGGSSRLGMGAVNPANGAVLGFNANLNGIVHTIALEGNNVIVGGTFTQFGLATSRIRLAMFNQTGITSAVLASNFTPIATDTILAVAVDPTRQLLFAGGLATYIGGKARTGLVAIDLKSGVPSAFDAGLNAGVNGIAVDTNGDVYLAGSFAQIGFGTSTRNGAAAVTAAGVVTAFDPALNADAEASAVALDGNDVIIGGNFSTAAALPRLNIGRFSKASGAHSVAFIGSTNAPVRALNIRSGELYVGGEFTTPGNRLVAMSPTTGALVRDYNMNGDVFGVVTNQRDLFATGSFNTAGPVSIVANGLVSIDRTANAFRWQANIGGTGRGIALAGNHVYVVGELTTENAKSYSSRTGAQDNSLHDTFHPFAAVPGTFATRGQANAVAIIAEKAVIGGEFNVSDFETGTPINTFGIAGGTGSNISRLDRASLISVHAN